MPNPAAFRAKSAPVHGVPITHEVGGRASPRGRVDHLAPDPGGGRVRGHCAVQRHRHPPRFTHIVSPVATPASRTRGRRWRRATRPGATSGGHDVAEPGRVTMYPNRTP